MTRLNAARIGKVAQILAERLVREDAQTVHAVGEAKNGEPEHLVLISVDPGLILKIGKLLEDTAEPDQDILIA